MVEVETSLYDSLSFDTVGLRLTYFRWHSLSRSQPSVWCTVILIRPTTLDRCIKQQCDTALSVSWLTIQSWLTEFNNIFFTNSKALSIFFAYFLLFWISVYLFLQLVLKLYRKSKGQKKCFWQYLVNVSKCFKGGWHSIHLDKFHWCLIADVWMANGEIDRPTSYSCVTPATTKK